MKRFVQLTLIIALAVGAVSCKKDEIINTVKETPKDTPTVKELPPMQKITLSASSTKPGLRIAYDASRGENDTDDNTLWQENDEIAVYKVGVNGAPARFKLVDGAGTSYGTFEGEIEPTGNYYGLYPYSAAGALDGTSIAITLPATQDYAANSFGRDAAVFAATSTIEEGGDVLLHFEPLLGYLSLSLTTLPNTIRDADSRVGMHTVGSIVLHENSLGGMSLSGATTVDMSSDKPQFVSAPTGGGLNVTLNCPSVPLSPTEAKEFIIAVPAGVLTKGFCATVNGTDGKKIMSLATTTPNIIKVNEIIKMPTQEVFNIEDFEGNRYPVAKIGAYFWTAENLKSTTYDTQSERPGAVLDFLPLGELRSKPFYMDPTNKSFWNPEREPQNPFIVNPEDYNEVCSQLSGWGYLYNWAAAVGYATVAEAEAQEVEFDYDRQGICPNGWHVPSIGEYLEFLTDYVRNGLPTAFYGYDVAGTFLKSVEGWSSTIPTGDNPDYALDKGVDDFGFSCLPTGRFTVYSTGESGYMSEVGGVADINTSSSDVIQYSSGSYLLIGWLRNYRQSFEWSWQNKEEGRMVRCLKDF